MKNKTKNNILIISIVSLSALTVIALVLITGFSSSGRRGNSSVPTEISIGDSLSESSAGSESETENPNSGYVDDTSSDVSEPASDPAGDEITQKIVSLANSLIGTPFAVNGETPSGFDNSGFIYYVLRENGYITCPRTTEAQSRMGSSVDRDKLKPGDLVFFGNSGSEEADIGGIYIGDGKMIACLMPDTTVREVDITTSYYRTNFIVGVSLS